MSDTNIAPEIVDRLCRFALAVQQLCRPEIDLTGKVVPDDLLAKAVLAAARHIWPDFADLVVLQREVDEALMLASGPRTVRELAALFLDAQLRALSGGGPPPTSEGK